MSKVMKCYEMGPLVLTKAMLIMSMTIYKTADLCLFANFMENSFVKYRLSYLQTQHDVIKGNKIRLWQAGLSLTR